MAAFQLKTRYRNLLLDILDSWPYELVDLLLEMVRPWWRIIVCGDASTYDETKSRRYVWCYDPEDDQCQRLPDLEKPVWFGQLFDLSKDGWMLTERHGVHVQVCDPVTLQWSVVPRTNEERLQDRLYMVNINHEWGMDQKIWRKIDVLDHSTGESGPLTDEEWTLRENGLHKPSPYSFWWSARRAWRWRCCARSAAGCASSTSNTCARCSKPSAWPLSAASPAPSCTI